MQKFPLIKASRDPNADKMIEFWKKIASGTHSNKDVEDAKLGVQDVLNKLEGKEVSETGKQNAEKQVEDLLIENGSARIQATTVAKEITNSIFDDNR